jgi:uncharacterized protein YciI
MTVLRISALFLALTVSLASAFAQAPAPPAPAAAPASQLFAAVYRTGPKWDAAKAPGDQPFFREHSANLAKLRAAGTLVMGARYGDVGLIVVTAPTEADARKLFEADPSIAAGTFALDVHRFSVFYSGMVGTPAPPK